MTRDEWRPSEAEIADFERRWREAMTRPIRHLEVLTPLPRRVRLRLAVERAITSVGIWLGDHVSWGAAKWLWRITGLLERRAG